MGKTPEKKPWNTTVTFHSRPAAGAPPYRHAPAAARGAEPHSRWARISGPVLEDLGIEPHSRRTFTLANGDLIERPLGDALFRYKEHRGAAPVVFGEPGDSNLLGVVTLEALGYVLDPLKRELRSLPMLLAGLATAPA